MYITYVHTSRNQALQLSHFCSRAVVVNERFGSLSMELRRGEGKEPRPARTAEDSEGGSQVCPSSIAFPCSTYWEAPSSLCNHRTSEWPDGAFQTSRKTQTSTQKRVARGSLESDTLVTPFLPTQSSDTEFAALFFFATMFMRSLPRTLALACGDNHIMHISRGRAGRSLLVVWHETQAYSILSS